MPSATATVVCNVLISGVETLVKISVPQVAVSTFIITTPGVGAPFWYWSPSVPGHVIGADFTSAPIVDADWNVNVASMAAITATPASVLTFA